MQDFKCAKCNKLLGRHQGSRKLEIKCPRCSYLNLYSTENDPGISAKKKNLAADGRN